MARWAWNASLWALALVAVGGCADSPMVLQGRISEYEKQQVAMSRQNQQLQDRARSLDQANQDLTARLALAGQQTQLAEEQLTALREQLRGVTAQLAESQAQRQNSDQKRRR